MIGECMSLQKTYIIISTRMESKDIVTLEALDESSKAPLLKTLIFRMGKDDYNDLGKPPIDTKFSLSVTIAKD